MMAFLHEDSDDIELALMSCTDGEVEGDLDLRSCTPATPCRTCKRNHRRPTRSWKQHRQHQYRE